MPVRAIGGNWYLWVVAIQSLVIAAAVLGVAGSGPERTAALVAWGTGAAGYLLVSGLITARLLRAGLQRTDPTAPYWVSMGAASITVLAGADLVAAAGPPSATSRGVLTWLTFAFWLVATCLIPPVVARSAIRHLHWREPLRYRTDLWMIVFPACTRTPAFTSGWRPACLPSPMSAAPRPGQPSPRGRCWPSPWESPSPTRLAGSPPG